MITMTLRGDTWYSWAGKDSQSWLRGKLRTSPLEGLFLPELNGIECAGRMRRTPLTEETDVRRTSLLWASGLALTSAAWAQDRGGAVTIYGIVDGGVEYARTSAGATTPARSLKSVVTGSQSASRLGLRITEDLGDGLRASAVLEHGFDVDTGSVTGTAFWGRDAYVGLGGKWGELRLGRTYTPGFWVLVSGDVNRLGFYGNAGGFARLGPSGQTRAANGVNYISPSLGGFVLRATYAFGESASAPTDAGRFMAVAGEYTKDPKSYRAETPLKRVEALVVLSAGNTSRRT
jgi:predicted porin